MFVGKGRGIGVKRSWVRLTRPGYYEERIAFLSITLSETIKKQINRFAEEKSRWVCVILDI